MCSRTISRELLGCDKSGCLRLPERVVAVMCVGNLGFAAGEVEIYLLCVGENSGVL